MVFQRAARREFAHSAAGIFVALFAIMVSIQAIRLLGDAASGRIASEAVWALLGFAALNYSAYLLTLTLFVAVLLSLSRSYRDSEMVVWFSSGVSLMAWIRPVLVFAMPLILAIAMLTLVLSPWAQQMSVEFKEKMQVRSDASQVAPGSFKEAASTDRVVFVEAIGDDETYVKNVFISAVQHGKLGVTMAGKGYQETAENGDRFMVLEGGRRYEVVPGTPEFRIMEFDRYALRVETRESRGIEKTVAAEPTLNLLRSSNRRDQAELLWRVNVPISAIVLALLAIPLSFVNPRAGRSANLILALLVYMIYSNLLSMMQAWVAQGRVSVLLGLLVVHLLMIVALPVMFARRILVFSFLRLRR
ncbi:MAG: lipopolysaccharide export system permease protein [Pseudomonadota bacterium]|nr:lipopolysaccharide export system permease protein [Pseudomonadota bacterium]MDQ5945565.1 lipopolysaccharide export system permease protein [Pseudomonadota bacterium]